MCVLIELTHIVQDAESLRHIYVIQNARRLSYQESAKQEMMMSANFKVLVLMMGR